MELEKALLMGTLTVTLWVALTLVSERRGAHQVSRPLAALLFSLCIPLIYFYTATLSLGGIAWLGHLALAGIWIKGPFLRMLTGAAVGVPLRFPLWHFAPFVTVCALMLVLPEQVRTLGLIGLLHALVYHAISGCLLVQRRSRLVRIYKGYPNSAFYWLLFVIVGLAAIMVVDFLMLGPGLIRGHLPLLAIKVSTLAITAYLIVIALCSLYRPNLFFGIAQVEREQSSISSQSTCKLEAEASSRSLRELTPAMAVELTKQLQNLMAQQSLYLDPELTLSSLARALGATSHQTSELLNSHMRTSYYDYLNHLRLEHAARLLCDQSCSQRIIDIAYESGFNNKNSFYRLFRQQFGMTPTAYRKKALNQQPIYINKGSVSIENDSQIKTTSNIEATN